MNILTALIPLYIVLGMIDSLYQFWNVQRLPSEGNNRIHYLSKWYLQRKCIRALLCFVFSLAVLIYVPEPTILIAAIGFWGYFILDMISDAMALFSFSILLMIAKFPFKLEHTPTTLNVGWFMFMLHTFFACLYIITYLV